MARKSNPPRTPPRSPVKGGKRWTFRLAAVVLIPSALLALLEMGLRRAGFGHPTDFYLHPTIAGRSVCVDNDQFGLRFFPERLLRAPKPNLFPVEKPAGTTRIVVFGESAAYGDPEPAFGVWRHLEVLLRERFPAHHFEVICAAMTAINSHTIREIAREVASLDADYWILYIGNNEMVGPYGAGTVFGSQAPGMRFIRANLALKRTRIGQLFEATLGLAAKRSSEKSWDGLKMFVKNPVPANSPNRARVYEHFRENFRAIVAMGLGAGARVMVSTMPVNLRDCGPFASMHGVGYEAAKTEWDQAFEAGKKLFLGGKGELALAEFKRAERLDGQFAELSYLIGQTHLLLGDPGKARGYLQAACDHDTLPFRATSTINEIIRAEAPLQSASQLIDSEKAFSAQSPLETAGREFFFEHVHLTFEGNYLLALMFAEGVSRGLPPDVRAGARPEWLGAGEVARHLAFTTWDEWQISERILQRILEAPYANRINHADEARRLEGITQALRDKMSLEQFGKDEAIYRAAVGAHGNDPHLRVDFARFLEGRNMNPEALEEWQRVEGLWPHHPMSYFFQGRILDLQGKAPAAEERLRKALALRPRLVEAMAELGACLVMQRRADEGMVYLEKALEREPNLPDLHLRRAEALKLLGRPGEMRVAYDRAVALNPSLVTSKVVLGKSLKEKGDLAGARAAFEQALQLKPDDVWANYGMAEALAAEGKRPESLGHLRRVVEAKPDFWQARYLYGVELALDEKIAEAAAEFQAAVSAKPDFVRAHLNLGVCQVKQGKLGEARKSFESVLVHDPKNGQAQEYLATLDHMTPAATPPPP